MTSFDFIDATIEGISPRTHTEGPRCIDYILGDRCVRNAFVKSGSLEESEMAFSQIAHYFQDKLGEQHTHHKVKEKIMALDKAFRATLKAVNLIASLMCTRS